MKTLTQQTKDAAAILIGIGILCITVSLMSGCAPFKGRDGFNGSAGSNGQSLVGPQGMAGAVGATGAPGADCTVTTVPANNVAPNGGSLISCPDGSSSLVLNGSAGATGATGVQGNTGATGAAGSAGTNGAAGTNGQNGTNGTVVTPIQFCAGITPSYPSAFPEVGFCIDGSIWAVYSANGGFLTEVTPGAYSSDGINASCNFTVEANCVIN